MIIDIEQQKRDSELFSLRDRTTEQMLSDKIISEKEWRNSELSRTDLLAILPDYPLLTELLIYRISLREYPSKEDFPNGERPIIL